MQINALPPFDGIGNSFGYSYLRQVVQAGLERRGVEVITAPHPVAPVMLCINDMGGFHKLAAGQKLIGYTMFETTELPPHMAQTVHACDRVMVPSRHNLRMMRDTGLRTRMDVVPMGVDTGLYTYRERKPRKDFTFLWCGATNNRKGPLDAYRAFMELGLPRAKFIIKTTRNPDKQFNINKIHDRNVKLINTKLSATELRDLYQRADCFVFPSKGEADIGLTTLEAMATGAPVIATGWLFRESDYPPYYYSLRSEVKHANYLTEYWGDCGDFAYPDIEHLKELMTYVYEHREEAYEQGRLMSAWVHANRSWERTIDGVYDVLRQEL